MQDQAANLGPARRRAMRQRYVAIAAGQSPFMFGSSWLARDVACEAGV